MSKNEEEEEKKRILVLGAAHADTRYRATGNIVPGHTSASSSDRSFGGVGYNVAKDLLSLGNIVAMVTPIGGDTVSRLIIANLERQGIEASTIVIPEQQTASYTAIHYPNGDRHAAAIVCDIYNEVSVKRLEQHLPKFKKADAIVTDSAFKEEVYTLLAWVSKQANKDLYVVLSSLETAKNINPLLGNCKGLFGNDQEINHLAGNYDASEKGLLRSLEFLATKGVEAVFAKHKDRGVFAIVEGERFHIKAQAVDKVISGHGAGDTLAAAIISEMRKGIRPEEAIRAGLAAAALRKEGKEINEITMRTAIIESAAAMQKAQKKMLFKLTTT